MVSALVFLALARLSGPSLGTLEVSLAQAGGVMPDGYGTILFRLSGADARSRLTKWTGRWKLGAESVDRLGEAWDGDGASRSSIVYLPKAYLGRAAPHVPQIVGTATVVEGGTERDEPFTLAVPAAKLKEPLETRLGAHVGLALQRSRWAKGEAPKSILPLLDAAYARMRTLTGVSPDGGKPIILQESPPNPYFAYAGNPVVLNGDYVAKTLKDASAGELPFGWIHELGHDFDVYGDWYIWNGPSAEFQANFKLAYVVETPIDGYRMVWDGYGHAAYPQPGGKTDGSGYRFVDQFFLLFGDAYLADSTRSWDSLTSDEIHSFFQRLVREYGWPVFRRWYRDYRSFAARGLKPPSTPAEKVALICALLSREAGVDLVPVFERWRFPVTAASSAAASKAYPLGPGA